MKTRLFPSLGLLLFLLASACAPAAPTEATQVAPASPAPVEATATLVQPVLSGATAVEGPIATQPAVVEVQPVATSRGPNLEATDPLTVSLASGQIHFVEFFRFT